MADDCSVRIMKRHSSTADKEQSASGSDDASLVAAALLDRHAFAIVYQRHADALYAYALARTGSAAVADDVVSDTMVEALASLERYDSHRGSLAGWLFTIAGRRIIDRHRASGRFHRALSRLRSHIEPDDDVAEMAIRNEEAGRVRAAVARLSGDDREIILLRYAAGLNSREIGDTLGLSAGAVRMRLSRATKRLANQLGTDE